MGAEIIKKLLGMLGWQKLLMMVWNAVQDDLKKAAAKTDNKIDDHGIEMADYIIKIICSVSAPAPIKK